MVRTVPRDPTITTLCANKEGSAAPKAVSDNHGYVMIAEGLPFIFRFDASQSRLLALGIVYSEQLHSVYSQKAAHS
jgi:hypothetical protein